MAFSDFNPPDIWLTEFEEVPEDLDSWQWADENKWAYIRYWRQGMLVWSDWTALQDVSISESEKQEWRTFRQQLRDLTAQSDDPEQLVPPSPPQGYTLPHPS